MRPLVLRTAKTLALLAALAGWAPPGAASAQPAPPYYSIDQGVVATRTAALERLRAGPPLAHLRAERRASGWRLRVGAFATRAEAEAALQQLPAERGVSRRVIRLENPVPWLLASGETVAAPAPAGVAPATTAQPPAPPALAAPPSQGPATPTTGPDAASGEDLTALDLEELMAMEITGVTRRPAAYAHAPAAIFVLTSEDIRRSGARTLADALRLVPGLHVRRTNAQSYSVTARGLGGDKLQVLLDHRSVYTPLTSMVFWDVFNTYLEDVARIEVIRGPGATVWGANAVNAVINIVTKRAHDTLGTHVHAGGGSEERAFGGFRSGGRIGRSGHGRVYALGLERDSTERADGSEAPDGISNLQAGTRLDFELGARGTLTLTGDIYEARMYTARFPTTERTESDAAGRNFGAHWTYGWSSGATTETSLYYDGYDRAIPLVFGESRDTYDLHVQHNFAPRGVHRLTWGTGVRVTHDTTAGPPAVAVFEPARRTAPTYSAFMQDEITLGNWSVVVGSKFEKNDFTGAELQPGVRLGWNAAQGLFAWASVAAATRTPNRLDHDIGLACRGLDDPPGFGCASAGQVVPIGSPDLDSERLTAYEAGVRTQLAPTVVVDVATFYNHYDDLRSNEAGFRFANEVRAESYGGEVTAAWEAVDWLKVDVFYSFVRIDARTSPASTDTTTVRALEGGTGQQSAGLRVGVQPAPEVRVDSFVRFVDNLPAPRVPTYTELNLRVGWQVTPLVELSLTGRNLLDPSHPESGTAPTRSEIPRSAFAELAWRWQ